MERDHFIITVYYLVADSYAHLFANAPLRQRGCAPALSDAEVITMEVCGEYFGFHQE